MTIRHLRIFVEVVDTGSMTGAAKNLFITQPSISQAIKELEDFYGTRLFERLSKQLYITHEGKILLSYARHILTSFDEMERVLKYSGESSRLKVGATITIGVCILSKLYSQFVLRHPGANMESIIDNTTVIEEMVLKSQLDFGLVEGPIHSKDIKSMPFMDDELILVCGKGHPFKERTHIPLEDLSKVDLILREKGSGTRELFENTVLPKGIDINVKWESNSSEAIKNAVMANIGVTVISRMIIAQELQDEKLFHIKIDNIEFKRKFNIIYHKNKYISEQIQSFWNLINHRAV